MSLFSSFSRKTAPRCEHLSPTGRQCSQPACSSHPTLCFVHKPKSEPAEVAKPHRTPAADAAFLAEITQVCGDLETPEQVRRALSLTLKAFVSRQISRETAGTTTYILQMLLRSLREIAYHKKLEREAAAKLAENDCTHIVLNMPTADRSGIDPEDIAMKEKELAELKEEAAKQASVAQASACVPSPNVECGSPTAVLTSAVMPIQPQPPKFPPPIVPPPTPRELQLNLSRQFPGICFHEESHHGRSLRSG